MVGQPRIGQRRRVLYGVDFAVGGEDAVFDRRGGGDQVQVELPLQPLLDDLHVEQPQEAAPEPEAQRLGSLRLVLQAGVVEHQPGQGILEFPIFA